jgi:hypothetical protein
MKEEWTRLQHSTSKLKLQIIDRGTSLVNRKIKEVKFFGEKQTNSQRQIRTEQSDTISSRVVIVCDFALVRPFTSFIFYLRDTVDFRSSRWFSILIRSCYFVHSQFAFVLLQFRFTF